MRLLVLGLIYSLGGGAEIAGLVMGLLEFRVASDRRARLIGRYDAIQSAPWRPPGPRHTWPIGNPPGWPTNVPKWSLATWSRVRMTPDIVTDMLATGRRTWLAVGLLVGGALLGAAGNIVSLFWA